MTKNLNSTSATCDSSPFSDKLVKKFEENCSIQKKGKYITPKHIFLSDILEEITFDNHSKKHILNKDCFYMKNLPNLTFVDFTKRIFKYLKPESSTIIISLIYIDMFLNIDREKMFLTENNIFKVYLSSIVLAIKYNEDDFDENDYFAKVGGITLPELNVLEREFVKIINYKLFVNDEVYKNYEDNFIDYNK